MICPKPNDDAILKIKEQRRDAKNKRLEKTKNMKSEKHMFDTMDDKMIQCAREGDGVDHIDDLDKNVNHADAQKIKNCVIDQS